MDLATHLSQDLMRIPKGPGQTLDPQNRQLPLYR